MGIGWRLMMRRSEKHFEILEMGNWEISFRQIFHHLIRTGCELKKLETDVSKRDFPIPKFQNAFPSYLCNPF
jgi:hypothetical protein